MTTNRQNQEFTEGFRLDNMLDLAIEWIQQHMDPEEVFACEYEKKLKDWARANGWKPQEDLDQWALDHGYVKKE